MEILVQHSLANPGDWVALDSADWAGLTKKPEPVGGEVFDQLPGWVNTICIQGMRLSGDYIVVIDRPDIEGCDVIVANVDPEDWAVPDRYVKHYTFLPLAPDLTKGGAINTRITYKVYAGATAIKRYDVANDPALTEALPMRDFLVPLEALKRYGIWRSDEDYAAHVTARTIKGWRDWGDHLDLSELDESGRIKGQREQGRWNKAKGTITYICRDTDRTVGWEAGEHEDAMETTTATLGSETATTAQESSEFEWIFTTPANEPNNADWPNGDYRIQYDVNAIDSDELITATNFARVSSDASTILQTLPTDGTNITTTGLHIRSVTVDPTAGAVGDRFGIRVTGQNVSLHMSQTITLDLNISDSFADGPWTVAFTATGALLLGTIAISGTGVGGAEGIGALALSGPTISGTGVAGADGVGALALGVPSIAGTGVEKFTATGALALSVPVIAGTGVGGAEGVGALLIAAPAIAGTGTARFEGSGALLLGVPVIAGTGIEELTATGALALSPIAIVGTGVAGADGVGALALGPPLIAGAAVQEFIASGALALAVPTIAGTGIFGEAADGAGALALATIAIAGTGVGGAEGTGALLLAVPSIAGTGVEQFTASGALLLGVPAISGTGVAGVEGIGALTIAVIVISGTGTSVVAGGRIWKLVGFSGLIGEGGGIIV